MKKLSLAAALSLALISLAIPALAQVPPDHEMAGPGGPPGPGGMFRIMGGEGGHPGKVITGSPFTGTETTTDTMTLANGTHITHTGTLLMYRDTNGRVRSERTFSGVGPWSSGEPKTIIEIFDPVAGYAFTLNPSTLKAVKRTLPAARPARTGTSDRPPPPASENVTKTTGSPITVAGVACTPTTTTRNIPANTFGNDQAIMITETKCYSSDLQMNVSTTRSDPRMGELTATFQNIALGAPDAALFAPSSNYTVTTGSGNRREALGFRGPRGQ